MAYCTASELRTWVGLSVSDLPDDNTIEVLRDQMEIKIAKDTTTSDDDELKYLCYMLSGARILRWIIQRAVKNGYVGFSIEGNSISKSVQEVLAVADKLESDYYDFLAMIENADSTATEFLSSAGIDSDVVTSIKYIMQNVNNIFDYENKYQPSQGRYS